ncbi:MAG: septation protein IspZ [Pseudomonadales bacterium]|nr:septation protein IspZ [Pseudomonadales bacterium]
MQQFLEYLAVIAFAVVFFSTRDVFIATAVLLIVITAQVAFYKLTGRTVSNELKIVFWLSLIMGGLTLVLRDETFIQWKPSIVSWAMALGLVGAMWFAKLLVLKKMLGSAITTEDAVWRKLTYGWTLGLTTNGFINLWVVYNYSMETWVTFKIFGLIGLQLLYVVVMVTYLVSIGAIKDDDAEPQPKTENSNEA